MQRLKTRRVWYLLEPENSSLYSRKFEILQNQISLAIRLMVLNVRSRKFCRRYPSLQKNSCSHCSHCLVHVVWFTLSVFEITNGKWQICLDLNRFATRRRSRNRNRKNTNLSLRRLPLESWGQTERHSNNGTTSDSKKRAERTRRPVGRIKESRRWPEGERNVVFSWLSSFLMGGGVRKSSFFDHTLKTVFVVP